MTELASPKPRLILPALGGLYCALHEGAETLLRLAAGGLLAVHGYGKILDPFGASGMVESLGFYPGAFWSPLLSATEFFGGILIAIGLFTRPVAFVLSGVMAFAYFLVHHPRSFFPLLNGGDAAVLYCFIFLYLFAAGGGSVDESHAIAHKPNATAPASRRIVPSSRVM